MQPALFEAAGPLCPRCLRQRECHAPLTIASRAEERGGALWHGILQCSNRECWLEFPVIDGVPVITADPAATLASLAAQLTRRDDLPPLIESVIGDSLGGGSDWDTARQHLSIYAGSQYADWTAEGGASTSAALMARALEGFPDLPPGIALDIGCGTGRGGWEIAVATGRPVIACDLSLTFLRLAQRLALEGRADFPCRRIGLVYDPVEIVVPESHSAAPVDFWALDALALPFAPGAAALAALVNVVDCIAGPTEALTEAARVMAPEGGVIVTTPYDWAPNVTPPAGWFGGHSQRAPHEGRGEPVLTATMVRAGLKPFREEPDLPWRLRLHARSEMAYALHVVLARKAADLAPVPAWP